MNEVSRFQKIVDHFVERDRLNSEGATVKNVSHNMSTLFVSAAMLGAVAVVIKNPRLVLGDQDGMLTLLIRAAAVLWGAWTVVYALLAAFQSSLLIIIAARGISSGVRGKPNVPNVIAWVVSILALGFMTGAVVLIIASFGAATTSSPGH